MNLRDRDVFARRSAAAPRDARRARARRDARRATTVKPRTMPRCGRSTTRGARVWIESDVAPETMVVALRLETSRATTRAPRRARAASARARGVLFALILRVARVSGSGSALVGEACGVDADCYDGYGCAGVCCSSTSGYGITNCQTCGQDVASGGNFVCLQCKPGYERFQWSNGYRCRRVCEANEFLKYSSDWTCTAKYSAGAGCSLNNDDWCQSGKCGSRLLLQRRRGECGLFHL